MRLLLDESLPRGLAALLRGHEVETVQSMNWAGRSNGNLLSVAVIEFDAFITADQNLGYQQNLQNFDIADFLLMARTARLSDLEPLIPKLLERLVSSCSGTVERIAFE